MTRDAAPVGGPRLLASAARPVGLHEIADARRDLRPPARAVEHAVVAHPGLYVVDPTCGRDAGAQVVRRLRLGMKLQTDPTVIYGLGDGFDGNLRRRDLTSDTPYNTYTRTGLPPTPIAMPGLAAIRAAVHPADGKTLYFVAKGDGTHYFSETLDEHNRAVRKYQLRRK